MALSWSTDTIMQPSPNHLAIRTPRSLAISRTSDRNDAEDAPGSVVAEGGGVVREPGQVDEGKRTWDSHGCSNLSHDDRWIRPLSSLLQMSSA